MSNKTIILTGATKGIGASAVKILLNSSKPCNLVLVARSHDALEKMRQTNPEHIRIVAGDLGNPATAQKAVDVALQEFGTIDAVVANAALLEAIDSIADANLDDWNRMFNVNVFGVIALAKAALPTLRQSKGKVIVTSAGAAVHPFSSWSCYSATKASVNIIVQVLKKEEPEVVSVSLDPGVAQTPMLEVAKGGSQKMTETDRNGVSEFWKHGVISPELPAAAMAKLCLHAPTDMSGEFIRYDSERISALPEIQ